MSLDLTLTLVTLKAIYLLLQTVSESSLDNGYHSVPAKKENNLVDKEKHTEMFDASLVPTQSGSLSLVEILEIVCSDWLNFTLLVPRSML